MARNPDRFYTAVHQRLLWTPRELPADTIGYWVDATEKMTASSNAVSDWYDISPRALASFAQATGGAKPTLVPATGPNGFATISFDGGDELVTSGGGTLSYSGGSGMTSYAVVENDGNATDRTIHACFNAAGAYQLRIKSDHTASVVRAQQAELIASTVTSNTSAFNIIGGSIATNFSAISVNGTETSNATNPAISAQTNTIGSNNGSEKFTGKMAEIVFCIKILDAWDRRRLEGYMAWRWGLQRSLVANHPYKNYPPMRGDAAPRVRMPQINSVAAAAAAARVRLPLLGVA